MRVYGLIIVRDEADIIRTNILYHLSLGLDRLLIIDNDSSDGTDSILKELSKDSRVRWTRDTGPWRAGDFATQLAREAYREGADWIVPIDTDEFWHVPGGSLRSVLKNSEAGALRVRTLNFIQRREQRESSPEALFHMTRRTPEPTAKDNIKPVRKLVESGQVALVELEPATKWIVRPSPDIEIARGYHDIQGLAGLRKVTDGIIRLHAPLRSLERLRAKAEAGERSEEAGRKPGESWHLMRYKQLRDEGRLEQEWAANSYTGDSLNVYGVRHKTIFDPTLRDAVAPFLEDNGGYEQQVLEKRSLWSRLTNRT
jgi:glycosyltransferase involved in cell wall biosynthesis